MKEEKCQNKNIKMRKKCMGQSSRELQLKLCNKFGKSKKIDKNKSIDLQKYMSNKLKLYNAEKQFKRWKMKNFQC
jgi:hypothetical protein